jgi:hypothetical protein
MASHSPSRKSNCLAASLVVGEVTSLIAARQGVFVLLEIAAYIQRTSRREKALPYPFADRLNWLFRRGGKKGLASGSEGGPDRHSISEERYGYSRLQPLHHARKKPRSFQRFTLVSTNPVAISADTAHSTTGFLHARQRTIQWRLPSTECTTIDPPHR